MNTILEINNLTKQFDGSVVLKGVSFNIHENEFITILGPSGCGKTTLLRIIAGLDKPDSGKVILYNKSLRNIPSFKRPVNTIFQSYALFPHMNVFDNIAYSLNIRKINKTIIKKQVKEFLKLVDLVGMENRKIHQLSGGQKQRVAIARALINKPKILLLDEPMSALDVKLRKQMQINLKNIQKEIGITFILVTHDQEEALFLSDKVLVMNDGSVEQIGTPEEIYNEPENSWVAGFVGLSNIIEDGLLIRKDLVQFDNIKFKCFTNHDFGTNENSIDIIIRPEDIDICKINSGYFNAQIISKNFKGIFWEIKVKYKNRIFLINTINEKLNLNDNVGIHWDPEDIHIMWKKIDT